MEAGIADMDWVIRSPYINPIENCCEASAAAVYDGGRQFESVEDLKERLIYEWENLSMQGISSLVASMPRWVWELHAKRCCETKC